MDKMPLEIVDRIFEMATVTLESEPDDVFKRCGRILWNDAFLDSMRHKLVRLLILSYVTRDALLLPEL